MTTFDYAAVPLETDSIRLVSLVSPAENIAQAKWNVKVASLGDESTRYCAVSYRWGAPLRDGRFISMTNDRAVPIQINDSIIMVAQNLSDFLDQVRSDDELKEKEFWIDAICINQDDPQERSHEVSTMMARIYRSATSVIAWLGDADLHTERAFSHLDKLTYPSETQSQSTNHSAPENAGSDGSSWDSTVKLFERTYWNRSWVIQELVLPKNITIRCGKHSRDWSVVSQASHNISTSTWREFFNKRDPERKSRKQARNYGIPTILKATKTTMAKEHWTTVLLYTLIRSRDFEATNLEDKVYSLIGLIQDSVDVGHLPLLCPDYGEDCSAARTYLRVAIQLLRDCEELLILSSVEGRSFQEVKLDGGELPSWVPDWSVRLPLGLRVTGQKRYSADACFTSPGSLLSREEKLRIWPAVVSEEERTVVIGGIKIDHISFSGEPKHAIQDGKPFPKLLNMFLSLPSQYQTTEEDQLEAFWRTLIANTADEGRLAPRESPILGQGFATWLQDGVNSVTVSQDEGRQWDEAKQRFNEFCEANSKWKEMSKAYSTPASGLSSSAAAEYWSFFSHGRHLRPFLTENGYLGLGSENLQEGDSVWVVPRSRVPLIFRRVKDASSGGDYHCELVGGSYLHGFMDGQALSAAAGRDGVRLNDALQRIVIH